MTSRTITPRSIDVHVVADPCLAVMNRAHFFSACGFLMPDRLASVGLFYA